MHGDIRGIKLLRIMIFAAAFLLLFLLQFSPGLAESNVSIRFHSVVYAENDGNTSITLYVEMTNQSRKSVNPALIQASVNTAGGECAGHLSDCPDITVQPGRTFCFEMHWFGQAGNDPQVLLAYPEDADDRSVKTTFYESAASIQRDDDLFDGVVIECRNPSSSTVVNQPVYVALYDEDGNILYVKSTTTGVVPVQSGGCTWIYWSPFSDQSFSTIDLISDARDVASARAFICYPVQSDNKLIYDDYLYELLENGKSCITGYTGSAAQLTLPEVIDGCLVSVIREQAFLDCDTIVSLTLPEGLEALECDAITRCASLETIVLPSSLTRIEDSQFTGCPRLKHIMLDPDNTVYMTTAEGVLFSRQDNMLLRYPQGRTESSYTVPQGTGILAAGAFEGNAHLVQVVLPESLREIRFGAFCQCENLAGINLPSQITTISKQAFQGTALTAVVIPAGVTSIENYAFYECGKLESVVLPDGLLSIGDSAFRQTALKELALPDTVLSIDSLAFMECTVLEKVIIPDSLCSVGTGIFCLCPSLTELCLSPDHPRLHYDSGMLIDTEEERIVCAFAALTETTAVVPADIRSIDPLAFSGQQNLVSIQLPDSLACLGDFAFSDCIQLESINIPESVTEMHTQVFSGCVSLREIKLPNSITELPMGTFNRCFALESVTLPETLKSIGRQAFAECRSLQSIHLPESVISIGYAAFSNCIRLQDINLPANVQFLGEKLFAESSGVVAVVRGGSAAENYCLKNGIQIQIADE